MKSSVLLIYTGGTIGMHTDPASGALVPFDFTHIYEEIPSLRRQEVDIEVLPFEPIDSSNASPELWVRLAEKIAENAGAALGRVASARMGVFQITGANSNEEFSAGGSFNLSSREKKARVTVRAEYKIKHKVK